MSLLLLLRPHGSAVIPPPPTPSAPAIVSGPKRIVQPPQLIRFPAGRARILLRATAPDLLLLPDLGRATVSFRGKRPALEIELHTPAKKRQLLYRAARDETNDEEFRRLAEAAYLLTR